MERTYAPLGVSTGDAEERCVHQGVVTTSELGVEPGAELEDGRQRSANGDGPGGRSYRSREQREERRLAGTVLADDTDRLAGCHREVELAERPELLVTRSTR